MVLNVKQPALSKDCHQATFSWVEISQGIIVPGVLLLPLSSFALEAAVLAPLGMYLADGPCLWIEPRASCWGSQELSQAGRQGVPSTWLEAWVRGVDYELSCSP